MRVRKQFKAAKRRMFFAQKGRCYYCGTLMTLGGNTRHGAINEHRIPLSRGGAHYRNLVLACGRCDSLKGDLTDIEFLAGIESAGGIDLYEKAHKRALLMGQMERERRRRARSEAFFNPDGKDELTRP